MECSRIPAAEEWEQFSPQQQDLFREHLESCVNCRRRFLREAPEKLLSAIQEPSMPEEFWIGFWDSLYGKLFHTEVQHFSLPVLRWAAVFVVGLILVFYSHHLPGPPLRASKHPVIPETFQYPLVENVQNPNATYYIFQPSGNEKIVMIVDPDLQL